MIENNFRIALSICKRATKTPPSIKKMMLVFAILMSIASTGGAQQVTRIFTDWNGYWTSDTSFVKDPLITYPHAGYPTTSHNLLGFTVGGTTYSTGVNNAALSANGITFTPQFFQALPVVQTPLPSTYTTSTVIGIGIETGGYGNVSPIPVTNNITNYLTDGARGLDIGTGVYNLPKLANIRYEVLSINAAAIGDGIPDIIITQIGQPNVWDPNVNDYFKLTNAAGVLVGDSVEVRTQDLTSTGRGFYKFYNPSKTGTSPTYNTLISNDIWKWRDLRLLAFDLSDFGITAGDLANVKYLVQRFSGYSDQAFIAYNSTSIQVLQAISGTVFNDPDGGVPSGLGYRGATVTLHDEGGATVGTTTTDINGYYYFPNVLPGAYTVRLTVPNGFDLTGAADGGTDNILNVTVSNVLITGQDFGITDRSLPVKFGELNAGFVTDELVVNWQTLTETNNDRFEIEASANGIDFTKIGEVKSKATPGLSESGVISYSFSTPVSAVAHLTIIAFALLSIPAVRGNKKLLSMLSIVVILGFVASCTKSQDRVIDNAQKTIYVRVAQVDIDGKYSYSKVLKVTKR